MSSGKDLPESLLPLDPDRLPRHVAIIMDGNGRWAQQRGLKRVQGHAAGVESVREVVRLARKLGLRYLTLYAFSEENWRRPAMEIRALMGLLSRYLREELEELRTNHIAFRAIGDLKRLTPAVQKELARAMAATGPDHRMVLTVALSYGGRSEIVRAAQSLAQEVQAGRLRPEEIDQALFSRSLYTADMPDPDLLIRTSGEYRLSNFLLWQSAYTELYFTDTHWPDFRQEEFLKALAEYQRRMRRYGLTQEQIEALEASNSRH
ncbi:MAG: di-trans,poly-cis-decaprenylcistransferase [Deltaproteobacteria bacterium RBG_13_60_28]|nr:MAG: di-trans,poly-cis-decaprenylcistransferase [Deltaproteobacteria bacterium RBG_13_60_28]